MAVIVLLLSASVTASAAPASALSCDTLQENRVIHLQGVLNEYRYSESYSSGGRPTRYAEARTNWTIGSTTIVVATCHNSSGWQIISPYTITPHYEGLIYTKGEFEMAGIRDKAWGTTARRVDRQSVSTHAFLCQRGYVWTSLGEIAGLPLPVPFAASVGQWLATKLLPSDKVRCGDLAQFTQKVTFDAHGNPHVTPRSSTFVQYTEINGPYKGVWEWTVTVKQV